MRSHQHFFLHFVHKQHNQSQQSLEITNLVSLTFLWKQCGGSIWFLGSPGQAADEIPSDFRFVTPLVPPWQSGSAAGPSLPRLVQFGLSGFWVALPCELSPEQPPCSQPWQSRETGAWNPARGRGCVWGVLQGNNYRCWRSWSPATCLPCVIPWVFTTISPPVSCSTSNLQSQCVLQPQQTLQTGPCGLWIHFLEHKKDWGLLKGSWSISIGLKLGIKINIC